MSKKLTYQELEKRVKKLEEKLIKLEPFENDLREKDKHLQSILESTAGFAIYQLIAEKENPYFLKVTFVSPSIKDVLGCKPENFSSETFFSNIHPDDLPRIEQANKNAFETNKFDETCRYFNCIKKCWIWIHAVSTGVVVDGHTTHVNGIFIDITKQKQAEDALREKTRDLKRLNEHILHTEENERKTFAEDLHDTVAQTLAISIFKIKNIQESGDPVNLEIISEIQGHLEQSVKEIHSLIYQLSPPVKFKKQIKYSQYCRVDQVCNIGRYHIQ